MASSVTRDVEALVDLFLSSTFDPFEESDSHGTWRHSDDSQVVLQSSVSGRQDDEDDGIEYEAAVDSDMEDDAEAIHEQPVIHSEQSTKQFGQILAKMGDDFFHSYTPKPTSGAAVPPWKSIGEQLKSVLIEVAQLKDTDPDAEQKKQEAWQHFKSILNSAVSDNIAADAFKLLGALLLSLHGLSEMVSAVKGLARSYFIRYIRERELDVEMQRLGGLNYLMQQELD